MALNGERRQDVGLKIIYSLLTGIIAIMLTVFFMKTFTTAEQALAMGNENGKNVAVLQQCIKTIDLYLAKMDMKLDTLLIIKKNGLY